MPRSCPCFTVPLHVTQYHKDETLHREGRLKGDSCIPTACVSLNTLNCVVDDQPRLRREYAPRRHILTTDSTIIPVL